MKKPLVIVLLTGLFALGACSSGSEDVASSAAKTVVSAGEEIVRQNCKVCHAQGINGAPVIGNEKMWGPRKAKGLEQLVANASSGFGLMPAKGGNEALTREQITEAVGYMLSQVP